MAVRNKPTWKQAAFAKAYVEENGNGTEAVIKAGYKVKSRAVARSLAPPLLAIPSVKHEIMTWQERLERSILPSLDVIEELRDTATDPRVRLAASKDLLSRAGAGKNQDKKTIVAVFAGMDETQLLEKMARLTGQNIAQHSGKVIEESHKIPCATQEKAEEEEKKGDGVPGSDAPPAS